MTSIQREPGEIGWHHPDDARRGLLLRARDAERTVAAMRVILKDLAPRNRASLLILCASADRRVAEIAAELCGRILYPEQQPQDGKDLDNSIAAGPEGS